MHCKIIRPTKGWYRILWKKDLVLTPEEQQILESIDEIPGCRLNDRSLDVPDSAVVVPEIQDFLHELGPTAYGDVVYTSGWGEDRSEFSLYPHQQAGVDVVLNSPYRSMLLADDMGLGKTATAAVAAHRYVTEYYQGYPKIIIIGPLFVRETWRQELLRLGLISKPEELCTIKTRNHDNVSWDREAIWTFVHYDVVSSWWSRLVNDHRYKPAVCICDEAHWVKNGRTKRAKGTAAVVLSADMRILLTGTPMENRPSDLWNLLTMVTGARTWGHPLDFRVRYCGAYQTGYGFQDAEPTHQAELKQRLASCYMRRTAKGEGLNLPDLTRSSRVVPLSRGVDRREHTQLLRQTPIDSIVRAIMEGQVREVLPTITKLRQITSRGKLQHTCDVIADLQEQGESCVVFSWERGTAMAIADAVKGDPVTGGQSNTVRENAVRNFQGSGGVLSATYGALREGVTLHTSRIVILHDLHWVLTHMLQAEKRIYRIGQKRACQSIWMLAENSIDMILAEVLLEKAKLTQEVLDINEGQEAVEEINLAEVFDETSFESRIAKLVDTWEKSKV
jgi:SWI/SNF-related matrix-associated actin-dependent regulator 1 of chromatin subfamily A